MKRMDDCKRKFLIFYYFEHDWINPINWGATFQEWTCSRCGKKKITDK